MMKVGWFGYGGNSWQALQLTDDLFGAGMELITCHEYENATVRYSPEIIGDFISLCDVIILPQRLRQPAKSTNKLAIAWANHAAVVASPLPEYLAYIDHGHNAMIAKDNKEMVRMCLEVCTNEGLRNKLRTNGYATATNAFNPVDLIHKYLSLKKAKIGHLHVVIPHYAKDKRYLDLTLESLRESLSYTDYSSSITVVSSSEVSPEAAGAEVIQLADKCSFSKAVNIGIKKAPPNTTHFLLLNDDVILSKSAIKEMLANSTPTTILNPHSNCDKGWLHNNDIVVGGTSLIPAMKYEEIYPIINAIKDVGQLGAATIDCPFCAFYATLIPRAMMDQVGYLNETFVNGGEDYDWCERAKRLGFRTAFTNAAFIFHFGGVSRKYHEDQNQQLHLQEDQFNNGLTKRMWQSKGRVGIWTGFAWEEWDLDSYKVGGIGGSETCAGRLAQEYANDGYHVQMIGAHKTQTQHNVDMINTSEFKPEENYYDLFIASRNLAPVNDSLRAKKIVAWSHDLWLLSGKEISQYHLNRINNFITLTEWHRGFFIDHHQIPAEYQHKVIVIPNGVNTELFE